MLNMIQTPRQTHKKLRNKGSAKILTSKGSVAINGAHASGVNCFSVGRNIVLT